jgi:hypothetical protein
MNRGPGVVHSARVTAARTQCKIARSWGASIHVPSAISTEHPESAFRVLGKIAQLEVFETETFPAEDVKLFFKELV